MMPAAVKWTPELESAILEGIESGLTLRKVAEKHNISAALIIKKVAAIPSFCEQYARAKQIQSEQFADELLNIADSADAENYNVARLQVDTRKWLLSKLLPKVYGDKLTHDGALELNISLADSISKARKRNEP